MDITPDAPNAIAVAGDRIWASTRSGVASIDPATNTAGPSHDLGGTTGSVSAIIAGNEAMWVVEYDEAVVVRLDPATLSVVARIDVPSLPEGAVATAGAIWVTAHHDGEVTRIDRRSSKARALPVGTAGENGPQGIAVGGGSIWVAAQSSGSVFRLDPAAAPLTRWPRIRRRNRLRPRAGPALTAVSPARPRGGPAGRGS